MIRTLLVSTDGSEHSNAAVELGADLAAKFSARLVLLHIGFRGGELPEDLLKAATEGFDQADKAGRWTSDHPEWSRRHQILEFMGRMILDNAQARAKQHGAGSVETLIDYGGAAERILHHANHLPADMIVMGSRGHNEIEGLMLGSVSHKVFHFAPCTCVTVHKTGQISGEKIKAVLVPTDGSKTTQKAIELGSEIAARSGARLILLHVRLRGVDYDTLYGSVDLDELSESSRTELDPKNHPVGRSPLSGWLAPGLSDNALSEIGERILDRAQSYAEARGVTTIERLIETGDAARLILQAAVNASADLIVMGTRGRGEIQGLIAGSVSYKVNHAAPCNCMVVR